MIENKIQESGRMEEGGQVDELGQEDIEINMLRGLEKKKQNYHYSQMAWPCM